MRTYHAIDDTARMRLLRSTLQRNMRRGNPFLETRPIPPAVWLAIGSIFGMAVMSLVVWLTVSP